MALFQSLFLSLSHTHTHTHTHTHSAWEDYKPFDNLVVPLTSKNISKNQQSSVTHFCSTFSPIDDDIVEETQSFFVVMTPISDRVEPSQPGVDRIEIEILDNDGKC